MSRKSFYFKLPEDLRISLDAEIIRRGFQDYIGLFAWLENELELRGLNVPCSRTAVWRHGRELETNSRPHFRIKSAASDISDAFENLTDNPENLRNVLCSLRKMALDQADLIDNIINLLPKTDGK